jgi:putative DNA primase/helicase
VQCPSHDDQKNSLSITAADEKFFMKCHAGCETQSILAPVGLKMADLFTTNGNGRDRDHDEIVAHYVYSDENGKPLFRICRTADT